MRRDLDFVRTILKTCAEAEEPVNATTFVDDTHPLPYVIYHFQLLKEAGLVNATITNTCDGAARASIDGLTWEGNDFLDAVQSDKLWTKVKQRIATTVGAVAFTVVKDTAVAVSKTMLGL